MDAHLASGTRRPPRTRPASSDASSTSTATTCEDLEVRRASLEDAYLALVQQHEAGHGEAARALRGGGDPMNPTRNAIHEVRLGLHRGWTEFSQSMRSTQDQGFYLFTAGITVGYLFLRRDTPRSRAPTCCCRRWRCPASSARSSPSA